MALPTKQQTRYYLIAAAVFIFLVWALGNVLLPFILGGAIAYFLDPVADRMERIGLSRAISTVLITLFAAVLFVMVFLLVMPMLIGQLGQLISQIGVVVQNLPQIWEYIVDILEERYPNLELEEDFLREQLTSLGRAIQSRGGEVVSLLLSSAQGIMNILVLIVIVPVVTFYLLLDWDRMLASIDDLMPRDQVETFRKIARDIDNTLASFIRGQGTVCLILAVYYSVALMLAGLNFALVVGVIAGLISFIPYVGAFVGGAMAFGVALFQWWGGSPVEVDGETVEQATNWLRIGIVGVVFAVGQFLEGNILTPKMVGKSVGLHPVWLIASLSVFGSLFGFVGMLIAVPIAAVLGVLARFFVGEYKDGRFYKGASK